MDPKLYDAPGWRSRFLLPDGTLPPLAGAQEPEAEETEVEAVEPEHAEASTEAPAPEGEAPDTESAPEMFSEGFDEESLPPEIRDRYRQMTADYTRKTQEAAPYRKLAEDLGIEDPADHDALFRALGEKLGFDIEEAEEEAAELGEEPAAEVDEFETEEPADEPDDESESDRLASLDEELTAIEQELGREITDPEELELLGSLAMVNPDGSIDLSRFLAVENHVQQRLTAQQLAWQESKESAPAAIPDGGGGAPAPNLDTPEGRQARMEEVMAAVNANA